MIAKVRLRLCGLASGIIGLGACLGAGIFLGGRRQAPLFWTAGALGIVLIGIGCNAFRAAEGRVRVSGRRFPGWVALLLGPAAGIVVGVEHVPGVEDMDLAGYVLAAAALGFLAGAAVWAQDVLLRRLAIEDAFAGSREQA